MIQKIFNMTLDTKRGVVESPIVVVKGDTGNVFRLRVQDEGADLDLTDADILVAFRGAHGSCTQDMLTGGVTVDGAVVSFPLYKDSVSEGTNSCDVQIYTDGLSLVTTAAFTFECRPATVGEDSIKADAGLPVLTELIRDMREACDRFPEVICEDIPGGHRIAVTAWNGTQTLCDVTDGVSGVYVGSGDMPDGYSVQIDPNGSADAVDYDSLYSKPTLNGTELVGDMNSADAGVADAVHTHTVSDVTDFPAGVSCFENDAGYISDLSAYRTANEQDTIDAGFAASVHTHPVSDVTGFPTGVSAFTNDAGYLTGHQDISGKADAADLARTERSLDALWKLNKGQTWDISTDTDLCCRKAVPSGAHYGSVDRIGGRVCIGNQILQKKETVMEMSGVTLTANADGSYTLNGTATADDYVPFRRIDYKAGTKVFCTGSVPGATFTHRVSVISASDYIYTEPADDYWGARYRFSAGTVFDRTVVHPAIVDLTEFFCGRDISDLVSANDPRMAQVRAWLAGHPGYCAGEVVSAAVTAVEAAAADSTVTHRETVPASVLGLDGYGLSVGSAENSIYTDGEKWWYRKEVGDVDLGTLSWSHYGAHPECHHAILNGIGHTDDSTRTDMLSPGFHADSWVHLAWTDEGAMATARLSGSPYIEMIDSTRNDSEFAAAMSGHRLCYKLAAPTVTDITSLVPDGFLTAFETEAGGTVTFRQTEDNEIQMPVQTSFIVKLDEV